MCAPFCVGHFPPRRKSTERQKANHNNKNWGIFQRKYIGYRSQNEKETKMAANLTSHLPVNKGQTPCIPHIEWVGQKYHPGNNHKGIWPLPMGKSKLKQHGAWSKFDNSCKKEQHFAAFPTTHAFVASCQTSWRHDFPSVNGYPVF